MCVCVLFCILWTYTKLCPYRLLYFRTCQCLLSCLSCLTSEVGEDVTSFSYMYSLQMISSYWFMKVFHDPWLRYVTFFNVVNVTLIVTCQPSAPAGKNLDEGFLTQPITAYHLCHALPLLLQRPCHPFQSVADQHKSNQIFSHSCLSLLTWKLPDESKNSRLCSVKWIKMLSSYPNCMTTRQTLNPWATSAEWVSLAKEPPERRRSWGISGVLDFATVEPESSKSEKELIANCGVLERAASKRAALHSNQDWILKVWKPTIDSTPPQVFRVPNQCQWFVISKIQSGLLSSVRNSVCVREAGCLPLDVLQSANFQMFQPTCQLRFNPLNSSSMAKAPFAYIEWLNHPQSIYIHSSSANPNFVDLW